MGKNKSTDVISSLAEHYTIYRAYGISKSWSIILTIGAPILGIVGLLVLAEIYAPGIIRHIFR